MIIQNSSYNIFFPVIANFRQQVFNYNLEEELGKSFLTPTLIPIPDDAPPEIPRVLCQSNQGHSNLVISKNALKLTTNYKGDYSKNWAECSGYTKRKIEVVFNSLKPITEGNLLFSGLTVNIIFDEIKDPIKHIQDKFLNYKESDNKPFDLNYKTTFVKDNKYYINLNFSNSRVVEVKKSTMKVVKEEEVHYLSFALDVNDRYAYNYKENYISNFNEIKEILKIADKIINDKISQVIKRGRFNVC